VTELIRGVVLWTIWLEKNKLVFTNKKACSAAVLGRKIINLAQHWCLQKGKVNLLKLSLVLPYEVENLIMHVLVLLEEEEEPVEKGIVKVGEEALAILPVTLNINPTYGREAE
jgi:hypothetical protein